MTTGRINQVTTFHPHTPGGMWRPIFTAIQAAFSVRSSSKGLINKSDCNWPRSASQLGHWGGPYWATPFKVDKSNSFNNLVPRNLTNFRLISPCHLTRIKAFRRNCLQLDTLSHGGFPSG